MYEYQCSALVAGRVGVGIVGWCHRSHVGVGVLVERWRICGSVWPYWVGVGVLDRQGCGCGREGRKCWVLVSALAASSMYMSSESIHSPRRNSPVLSLQIRGKPVEILIASSVNIIIRVLSFRRQNVVWIHRRARKIHIGR